MKINTIIIGVLVLLLLACNDKQENTSLAFESSNLNSSKTDTLQVGTKIQLDITKLEQNNTYTIICKNSLNNTIKTFTKKEGQNFLDLPKEISYKKGLLWVEIFKDQNKIFEKKYYLLPQSKVQNLENYFGQKFMDLDISPNPQIISLLLDKYDNTTSPEFPIIYTLNQEKNTKVLEIKNPQNICIYDDTDVKKTGEKSVSIHYQNIFSEEEIYYITSGFAENFMINAELENNLADGNSLYTLKTNVIKDKYGNILEDGSVVSFTIKNNFTNYSIEATTINGIAETRILHPEKSQKIQISANCKPYAKSNTIDLNFNTAIQKLPYQQTKNGIHIGPIATILGNYVAENTPVFIEVQNVQNSSKICYEVRSTNGFANFTWPPNLKAGEYMVKLSCLGFIEKPFKIALK